MVDSNRQIARISTKIEDAGSVVLRKRVNQLQQAADNIFTQDVTKVNFTGQSLIFLKSNQYLIKSLIYSLSLAFILISIIMGLLFVKVRMIIISLIPNFIPLLLTAGIMGFAGIPLKPSTVLVFSIAFGISVDDALHFLVKYSQELKNHNWNIQKTVDVSLRETGVSMIYTSLVLFFGFTIFLFSSFGGTTYLGLLTSITLLIAMVTNLVLLPSLIRSFDRKRSSIIEAMKPG
jgi:predicted RND superfamily exporter protein